ncbi:MAG: type I glyceraldehyde-3-phosphate dehydrogenase [Planctomycetota bacterium]
MAIRVGINGFGRIGRMVFRVMYDRRDQFETVLINDLGKPDALAYLLKYDSSQGRFKGDVKAGDGCIIVDGKKIQVTTEKDPANLSWKANDVYFVVESTGVFRKRSDLEKHLKAGAKKVLLTVPPKDEIDATIVLGVNDEKLKASDKFISNASCTTNCLAPMAKVLNDNFTITRGLMTTIHAYTNDQRISDLIHPEDLRRARAAAINIIPTSTGAAKAIGAVIPELDKKLNGLAMRVPVIDGSVTDLVAICEKPVSVEAVNAAMKKAAEGKMKGILEYCEDEIVSSDVIGTTASCVFDAPSTMVIGNMVKVIGWYDNEWAYSNRVADLMALSARL